MLSPDVFSSLRSPSTRKKYPRPNGSLLRDAPDAPVSQPAPRFFPARGAYHHLLLNLLIRRRNSAVSISRMQQKTTTETENSLVSRFETNCDIPLSAGVKDW